MDRRQESDGHDLALVVSDLGPGGAQRVLTTLAVAWADRGLDVAVITLSDEASDFYRLDPKVTRVAIDVMGASRSPAGAVAANIRRVRALRRAVRETGASRVVSFVGSTNILAILATVGLNVHLVISERNDPALQRLGQPWDLLRRMLYRFADRVTANSTGALATMRSYVPGRKLAFVPNPVPAVEDNSEERLPVILSVGSLTYQKAHDVLLRAFAEIAPTRHEWRLVILGEGELRPELENLARDLGIAERVSLPGRVADPFVWYGRASIFVLASRFEGTPNALLEAMASGLPPIVSDASSGPLEYVRNGHTGLVVPPEDVAALKTAMAELMALPIERATLGAAAREVVRGHTITQILREWDEAIGLQAGRGASRENLELPPHGGTTSDQTGIGEPGR